DTSGGGASSAGPWIAPGGRSSSCRASAGSATEIRTGGVGVSEEEGDAWAGASAGGTAASGAALTCTSTAPEAEKSPGPVGNTTSAPQFHTARAHTSVRQCGGRSRPTRTPGVASASSCSRFVALVTQLVKTVPVSSTRSEPSPYHVSTGPAGPSAQVFSRAGIGAVLVSTTPAYACR